MIAAGMTPAGAGGGLSAPAPAEKAWALDIALHDPQRIKVRLPGEDAARTYWYVLYTVTNNTGQDVPFFPTFHLVTDALDVIEGGDGISPTVYDAVKARHQQVYPFFVFPPEVYGTLRQGEDNALTSAIAFIPPDPAVNHFTLHVAGLSGEIGKTRNEAFDESKPESTENPRFFLLRRTLAVQFDIPGDLQTRLTATPMRVATEWVMR